MLQVCLLVTILVETYLISTIYHQPLLCGVLQKALVLSMSISVGPEGISSGFVSAACGHVVPESRYTRIIVGVVKMDCCLDIQVAGSPSIKTKYSQKVTFSSKAIGVGKGMLFKGQYISPPLERATFRCIKSCQYYTIGCSNIHLTTKIFNLFLTE